MVEEVEVGDVVQITNKHNDWYPMFVVVDEVKSRGIKGYFFIPMSLKDVRPASVKLNSHEYERIGKTVIEVGEEHD